MIWIALGWELDEKMHVQLSWLSIQVRSPGEVDLLPLG
jgi:hypothetical protein